MQNLGKYNQVLDSKGSLKLPGEVDPDFARVVTDYLDRFHCVIHLSKGLFDKKELYQWCTDYMGEKYKDWAIYEGGAYDKVWVVNIRDPKRAMLFELAWSEIIIKTIDRISE